MPGRVPLELAEREGAIMARPWRLDHSTVLDNDGNPVAIIADPAGDGGGERIAWPWAYDEAPPASYAQAEDNARLIAAAPELLVALTALLRSRPSPGPIPWAQAEAAIAKATEGREVSA